MNTSLWHYLFLALDLGSIAIPLFFSFHPKTPFYKTWSSAWPALTLTAFFFISWDMLFTSRGIWGFNPAYNTGYLLGNLPMEEALFFICIPYACLYTYFVVARSLRGFVFKQENLVNYSLLAGCVLVVILSRGRWYPTVTFSLLAALLVVLKFWAKVKYLGRFYLAYAIILIPFFLVNGILTGSGIQEEVVWYDQTENLTYRMGTIPVEDVFYGMLLILLNVSLYEAFLKNKSKVFRPGRAQG